MTLKWSAPRSDGGAPINNYLVEMRVAGSYRWEVVNSGQRLTASGITLTDFLPETDYEFRVSAENQAGLGKSSPASRSAKYGECSPVVVYRI